MSFNCSRIKSYNDSKENITLLKQYVVEMCGLHVDDIANEYISYEDIIIPYMSIYKPTYKSRATLKLTFGPDTNLQHLNKVCGTYVTYENSILKIDLDIPTSAPNPNVSVIMPGSLSFF